LLSSTLLHSQVREKGGAYGGGLTVGGQTMSFYSYRDPNVGTTLEVFSSALDWVRSNAFSDRDIEEAKLSVLAGMDVPVPPGGRGMTLFKYRITDEMRQQFRDRLFATTRQDMQRVAEQYLAAESAVCILGTKQQSSEATQALGSQQPFDVISLEELSARLVKTP